MWFFEVFNNIIDIFWYRYGTKGWKKLTLIAIPTFETIIRSFTHDIMYISHLVKYFCHFSQCKNAWTFLLHFGIIGNFNLNYLLLTFLQTTVNKGQSISNKADLIFNFENLINWSELVCTLILYFFPFKKKYVNVISLAFLGKTLLNRRDSLLRNQSIWNVNNIYCRTIMMFDLSTTLKLTITTFSSVFVMLPPTIRQRLIVFSLTVSICTPLFSRHCVWALNSWRVLSLC